MGRRQQRPAKKLDPFVAITTPGGRRSLGSLLHKDLDGALAAALALLEAPPSDAKQLVWLLAYAGRAALGPTLVRPVERPHARAALDERFAWFVELLQHRDDKVRAAATIPIAACRTNAAAAQIALHAEKERAKTIEMACAIRLAAGVLSRESPSLFEHEPIQYGQPSYYGNVMARHFTGDASAFELEIVLYLGERTFGKIVWFESRYEPARVARAMIRECPIADREKAAIALVDDSKPARAIEVVFENREVLPRETRDDLLRAITFVRDLSPVQMAVLAAPIQKCRHFSQINFLCAYYRIPHTPAGRASLIGDGAIVALVDELAAATLDGVSGEARIAPADLAEELCDDAWFLTLFFQHKPAYAFVRS